MTRAKSLVSFLGCGLYSMLVLAQGAWAARADYLSPQSLVADEAAGKLYIAEVTAKQVAVFDLQSGMVSKTFSLPDQPGGVALSHDKAFLYVTGAAPRGRLHVIDLKKEKLAHSIAVGHTPVAPVVSPNNKTLYVCNRFDNDVWVIDLDTKKIKWVHPEKELGELVPGDDVFV